MKKLIFICCLLLSVNCFADAAQDWNKRFSELNNVPLNVKWSSAGQQAYLKQLMASKPSYYKNPDDYRVPIAPPPAPYVAPAQGEPAKNIINRIRADLDSLEKLK